MTEENKLDATTLVDRLTKIRERLFWLHSVWATTLSSDIWMEAEAYRRTFQELGDQLKRQDRDAFDRLVAGHEALLLSEPAPQKPTIPLAVQQLYELRQEAPLLKRKPVRSIGYVADGLQSLL